MGKIVLLDELTINQIAAGEVIERPANVIKELVENSLDAGAKNITVEIKKGGKSYIKVTDDGDGIKEEDLIISIERHATSKITNIEELEETYTMGFRGEALASIASISYLSIITRTKESLGGTKMTTKAGEVISIEEVGCRKGTTICVENLFFNTPVRYKFLKQDRTECRYIKEWIEKTALVNTKVSFKLINDGKITFSSDGSGDIHKIIYNVYGKEIQKNLVDVNYTEEKITITGVIGNTMIAKENRKNQIIFLNKRNIKNNALTDSIDQAFKGSIGIGKYGFCILNIEMPADYYDVNVHPTKKEVRFKEEGRVCKTVYNAIRNGLLNSEFLSNEENETKDEYIENEYNFITSKFKNDEILKGNLLEKEEKTLLSRENKRNIDYKYIGILFKTYILVEIGDVLYLIDQHAAHERVLYEKIKENYKRNLQNNTQMTFIPEIISLTAREMDFILHNKRLFTNCGFDIEFFGENTVKINGVPDLEYRTKTKNIFLDILDEMITNTRTSIKDIEERFIATVACKAAVKANMDLNNQEVDKLIQDLLSLNNPYTCPHGRPTNIKIELEELNNKF